MIEIFFLFLIAPFSIGNNIDNEELSFSVTLQEKQINEQIQEADKTTYGEKEKSKGLASVRGFADDTIDSFFQNERKTQALAFGFFQTNNRFEIGQKFFLMNYLGSINILVFKTLAEQKAKEVLLKEPKQSFVQIIKGCALEISNDCIVARSGAGEEFEELYKLRIDTFLEVDEVVINDKDEVWYKIKHEENLPHLERIKGEWFVSENNVKVIEISEEVISDQDKNKKIVIDISEQILRAYENDELIIESSVSTGLPGRHATPEGEFQISKKIPSRYMQAPSPGIQDWYDLPGVPFVMYFTDEGEAIHGTYWHDKFGRRWSHGCVNMPFSVSKFLYEWAPLDTKVVVER